MILTASRDAAFQEPFNFKNERGQLLTLPTGTYGLTLERGDYVKHFDNLLIRRGSVIWKMTASEVAELPYSTFYFNLYFNEQPLASGVLRVK